jgi:DNA repair ATPase RecN
MFFLFSILYLATMVHAQPINPNCKDIAEKMIRGDIQINKIQKQMTNAIGNVYGETDRQEQKSKNHPKRMDRHNRHVNILVHNLGRRVSNMKELLEDAKQQGNNCQEIARKISGKVNAMQSIHAEMERSLGDTKTSEREFQELIKNLKRQANGTPSELQSAVR